MVLFNVFNNLNEFVERKSKTKFYDYRYAALLFFISMIFALPEVLLYFKGESSLHNTGWETVILKSKDLTNNLSHVDPYLWKSKKVFRLTIPVIMKVFNLTVTNIVILQILIGYFFFLFSFRLSKDILGDSVQATFFTFGLAFLYLGRASLFEYGNAWFDGFSYFFLLLALYSKNIFSVFTFSMLAAWNDERAFLGLSLVFLFHYFQTYQIDKPSYWNITNINKSAIFVIIAMFAYLLIRYMLFSIYNMQTPTAGANLDVIRQTYSFLPIGLFSFFEGYYFLLFAFVFLFFDKGSNYIKLFWVGSASIILFVVSFCVTDVTRSGTFAFPLIFIAIQHIRAHLSNGELKILLLLSSLFTLFVPPIFICVDWDTVEFFPTSSLMWIIRKTLLLFM